MVEIQETLGFCRMPCSHSCFSELSPGGLQEVDMGMSLLLTYFQSGKMLISDAEHRRDVGLLPGNARRGCNTAGCALSKKPDAWPTFVGIVRNGRMEITQRLCDGEVDLGTLQVEPSCSFYHWTLVAHCQHTMLLLQKSDRLTICTGRGDDPSARHARCRYMTVWDVSIEQQRRKGGRR